MVIKTISTMPLGAPEDCGQECAIDVTTYIKNVLFSEVAVDVAPGYVVARKLNQAEYDNTIRDLFGFEDDYSPSTEYNFAQDGFRSGFNNNAEGLTVAPLDVENYLNAAKGIVDKSLSDERTAANIMICTPNDVGMPEACLQEILESILPRIYRRSVNNLDFTTLLTTASDVYLLGGSFTEQVKAMLINALLMPDFLYRTETPPEGSEEVRDLNSYEVANRLSYFLWSSMPDDALLAAAANGSLLNSTTLNAQVTRMLADSKANSLAEELTKQWFQTNALSEVIRDGEVLSDELASAMETEVLLLVRDAVLGDITIKGLLNSSYTYLNATLAEHYGMNASALGLGAEFERVDFDPNSDERGGLLRMTSFLSINATSAANSPVKRGKWVLERLLCSPPPPPPANIPSFEPETGGEAVGSLRTQTEAFFDAPGRESCNVCHQSMNGIGFSFEHYDVNGRYRTDDNSYAIDASGILASTGVTFDGVSGLIDAITDDDRLSSCVVELNLPTEIVSSSGTCPLESAPSDASSYQDTVTQMIDLIALAFQCDKTRVITYMLEDSLNTPARYGFLGVNDSFHSISHHGGNSSNLDKIQTINTWEVEQFASLLDKLGSIQEGDGTVLDNSFLLFTSEFGDADDHYHWDLPMLTAGKAGGYLKTGQHISYDISSRGNPEPSLNDKPMADLFLNVLESFNINQSTFGTTNSSDPYGTSTLSEIKA